MFPNPSLVTRIGIGKLVGLAVGLAGFFSLPLFDPAADLMLRWGVLLWYTTMGAIVGMFGVFNWHPVLRLPMPWWLRAPLIGGWLNLVLVFFAHEKMRALMETIFAPGVMTSPWWFVLEGAVVGLLIGYVATRLGGEGPETVRELSPS